MQQLSGTVALVTGSSRGIGKACALRLAAAGAKVIVHYHTSEEAAKKTLGELGEYGLGMVAADVANMDNVVSLCEQVLAAWPDINLLVNNAGVYQSLGFLDSTLAEQMVMWQNMIATNLLSTVALSHAFAGHFAKSGGGKVINVASRSGFRGEAGASAYAASKAAMVSLTKSLATELVKDRVYVYAVAPGWTETAMGRPSSAAHLDQILSTIPYGRMATVDEVAAAVAYLATPETDYLTGITIDINGASYLR